jgi:hypothetical protein
VSTLEVSNVLNKLDAIHDANVYGVEVPGTITVNMFYSSLTKAIKLNYCLTYTA